MNNDDMRAVIKTSGIMVFLRDDVNVSMYSASPRSALMTGLQLHSETTSLHSSKLPPPSCIFISAALWLLAY